MKVQSYHGGSLKGKDVQKIMSNSGEIFSIFATILKDHNKDDCTLSDNDINDIYFRFGNLFMLWDGAFSYASIADPTNEDIQWYNWFIKTAVDCHVKIGCNVTSKVHLMWKHVVKQMRVIPQVLSQKRENWVEYYIKSPL